MAGAIAGIVLLAVAVGLAIALFQSEEPPPVARGSQPPQSTAPPTTARPEFTRESAEQAIRDFVELRRRALRTLDTSILDQIYTKDCECLDRDRKIIADLRKKGWRLNRSTFEVQTVKVTSWEPVGRMAVIEFTAKSEGADYVNKQGEVVEREAGGGVGRYQANLLWNGSAWQQGLVVRVE